jgi:hypothetical protein
MASGQLWEPGCGPEITDYFLAGTDPIATCVPTTNPNPGMEGTPGLGPTPVDTSFGFPAPTPPTRPEARTSPGVAVSPGAAPVPRPSGSRPPRDTAGRTAPAPRDTSNPFALPPSPPQNR